MSNIIGLQTPFLKAFSVSYPCQTQQIFFLLQRRMMLGHLRKMNTSANNNIK